MPVIGLGTWKLTGKSCIRTMRMALELGYRHIDTAFIYGNQTEISTALKESSVDRSELFITSKIWKNSLTYEGVLDQADEILDQLGMDYVDLLLVHWPSIDVPIEETISAFGELAESGKARDIGVSNFTVDDLKGALKASSTPISNNQIKFNPYEKPEEILNFCRDNDISITAYSPLARGDIFGRDGVLDEIAEAKGKSNAQITLRWLLQKGMVVIPKASSSHHLQENLDLFDWELTREEMEKIDSL